MKRDMDLIRKLLFELEGSRTEDFKEYTNLQIDFHKHLLIEAGLAKGKSYMVAGNGGLPQGLLYFLTWEGYEFLDTVRDEGLWKKVKDKVITGAKTASLEMVKQAAGYFTKQALGIG